MKTIVLTILVTLTLVFASNAVLADSIVAAYTCKLKEGKKKEDVQAINSKWLKWVRENVNESIESSFGSAVVGDQSIFLFIDTYPDLNTWAATQTALDSDAASNLEEMFSDVSECSENRLWKLEPTK
ncbi:MAG: hypothetical protein PVF46_05980 [Lysobacterales bacterium]